MKELLRIKHLNELFQLISHILQAEVLLIKSYIATACSAESGIKISSGKEHFTTPFVLRITDLGF